ncbi:hypothetical protein HOE04_04960 [archaeon]|jgi:hypothetical protein|nr:hypothetical protein [archaeon]
MIEYTENRDKPVNNIYWVPIIAVSFMKCLEGEVARGHEEVKTLSQGRDAESARENLRDSPGFGENWNKLTPEKRKLFAPFWLDYDKKVEKVLYCERRFKNSREGYTCGKPVNENGEYDFDGLNGEFGGCCIHLAFDIPDFEDCPYYGTGY